MVLAHLDPHDLLSHPQAPSYRMRGSGHGYFNVSLIKDMRGIHERALAHGFEC